MKKKQFKLPKEFALKWLEALRSGKYRQGESYLSFPDTEDDAINYYCCLGVAALICDVSQDKLYNIELLYPEKFEHTTIPTELLGEQGNSPLVDVLTRLNDGVAEKDNDITKSDSLIFRTDITVHDFKEKRYKLNFNQIADFIEDNCEFYETEESKK